MWARHSRAQQRAADPMTPRRGPEAGTNCKRQPRSPAAHRLKTAAEGHSTHQHSLTGRPSLTHGVPPLLLGHEQCSVIHNREHQRTRGDPEAAPAGGVASAPRNTWPSWSPTATSWPTWNASLPASAPATRSTTTRCRQARTRPTTAMAPTLSPRTNTSRWWEGCGTNPVPQPLTGGHAIGSACGAAYFNSVPLPFRPSIITGGPPHKGPLRPTARSDFPSRSLRSLEITAPDPCCLPGPDAGC